jgi:hypothetical protein
MNMSFFLALELRLTTTCCNVHPCDLCIVFAATVRAFDVVQADVSSEVKRKLISLLPKNLSDTAILSEEVTLAVNMKYDFTVNVDVTDGLTNGASCVVKMIENRQKDKTSRPSIVWVKFDKRPFNVKNWCP